MTNLLKDEIKRASKSQAYVFQPSKNFLYRGYISKRISCPCRCLWGEKFLRLYRKTFSMFKYFLLPEICQSRKLRPIPNFDYFSSINQKRKVYQASPNNLDSQKCVQLLLSIGTNAEPKKGFLPSKHFFELLITNIYHWKYGKPKFYPVNKNV